MPAKPFYCFAMTRPTKTNITILASGNGSNAENLANYFRNHPEIDVRLIVSNKPDAFVLQRAERLGIPHKVFSPADWKHSENIQQILDAYQTDYIVLAGYLLLIPAWLCERYPNRIINIHPALLPAYGGKGMYGSRVHEAVVQAGERVSGISIHYVNACYDEGEIIFQAQCALSANETPESLAAKIHQLEYLHFPKVVEQVLTKTRNPANHQDCTPNCGG